ncbi:MAG: DNA polymerase III subunit gamma/tau [Acutalibacteraceae bacterium]
MYQVLYRKYRPKCFADVVGQPQVTHTLKNELKAGRLSHAYLFTGSRGTGKTTCAKILSKAVNCLSPQNGDPCGECEICRGIDDGSILDVVEIDAASNNSVEDIRSLREEVAYTPARAKFRVYIIDEVHMLSAGAFNALLKTLEEPPEYVIFILATTELHKIPATILSRCQRFDFHRISQSDIADRLESVCTAEGAVIDRNSALMVAGLADGAMRDALSLLDRCLSINNKVDEKIVQNALGLTGKTHLIKMTDAVLSGDAAAALEIISELYNASRDMALLCDEWIAHYRAMMLCKTVKNAKTLLVMSDNEFQAVMEQAEKTSLEVILQSLNILQEAHERMMRSVNRRTELEMTIIRMSMSQTVLPETAVGTALPSDVAERLEKLEKAVAYLVKNPQTVPTAEETAPPQTSTQPLRQVTKQPSFADMEKLRRDAVPMKQWPEVIADIKKYSKAIGASFDGSTAYISGKYVLVDSKNDICFELLRVSSQRDRMRDSIKRITGKEYSLGRYSYPDEIKSDDPLEQFASDIQQAGIPVQKINDTNGGN